LYRRKKKSGALAGGWKGSYWDTEKGNLYLDVRKRKVALGDWPERKNLEGEGGGVIIRGEFKGTWSKKGDVSRRKKGLEQ